MVNLRSVTPLQTVRVPGPGLVKVAEYDPNVLLDERVQLRGELVVEALRVHHVKPVLLQLAHQVVVRLQEIMSKVCHI